MKRVPLLLLNRCLGEESGREELPERGRPTKSWSEAAPSSAFPGQTHSPFRKHRDSWQVLLRVVPSSFLECSLLLANSIDFGHGIPPDLWVMQTKC